MTTKTTKARRRCKSCGAPEKITDGLLTNIGPYSGVCVECINTMMYRTAESLAKEYKGGLMEIRDKREAKLPPAH